MDIQRKGVRKRKIIVGTIVTVVIVAALGGLGYVTMKLKPAAPPWNSLPSGPTR